MTEARSCSTAEYFAVSIYRERRALGTLMSADSVVGQSGWIALLGLLAIISAPFAVKVGDV